jgi:hypothetical protein
LFHHEVNVVWGQMVAAYGCQKHVEGLPVMVIDVAANRCDNACSNLPFLFFFLSTLLVFAFRPLN